MQITRPCIALIVFYLLVSYQALARVNPWELATSIYQGDSAAIGSYANGCLSGAQALPLTGEGYQVIRSQRQRYYGHPNLVTFISQYSKQLSHEGINNILIGDMSMPRGGQFDFGHSSHQIGLDVDIWLKLTDRSLTNEQIQKPMHQSVVNKASFSVNDAWLNKHRTMLKLAAQHDQVARIFVSPVIKQQLCNERNKNDLWLQKIRPWWGHTSHMHVRLKCPEGNSLCKDQKAIKPGHGCEELTWWKNQMKLAANQKTTAKPKSQNEDKPKPKPLKTKPLYCDELVQNG
ncbi:penicillin-insensitive murein endopeptidase [Shewanella donghaensis]|uniref:penicillin-insensitive murein endopeptidase n=1 Tax=Shewanella donghaensis TaxID=238836 RepID=UPI001D049AB2|nr:penicillin-insensitive murein endopeptidase [Shewanella donghaensis]